MTYDQEELVNAGVQFLQAATRCLGAEAAQEVWQGITQHLPELRGEVWNAMLMGFKGGQIVIRPSAHDSCNKVKMIKALRQVSGWGLKEAKDAVFDLLDKNKAFIVTLNCDRKSARYTLLEGGFVDID